MNGLLKFAMQLLAFPAAVVTAWAGLYAGLVVNSTLGSLLWLVAFGIFVGNVVWITMSLKERFGNRNTPSEWHPEPRRPSGDRRE